MNNSENIADVCRSKAVPLRVFWALWLFGSVVVMAVPTILFTSPFYLFPSTRSFRIGGRIMRWCNVVLFKMQPWMKKTIRWSVPYELGRSRKGAILVSNHRSALDIYLLLTKLPGIRIVTKSTLFKIPVMGLMMHAMKLFYVRRGDPASWLETARATKAAVKEGHIVHFFPENTRCREGLQGTEKFSLAPFEVAISTGAPLYPIVFKDTDQAWPKDRLAIRSGVNMQMISLAAIDPAEFTCASELMHEVRSRINRCLE